jgi:hypothetical protein
MSTLLNVKLPEVEEAQSMDVRRTCGVYTEFGFGKGLNCATIVIDLGPPGDSSFDKLSFGIRVHSNEPGEVMWAETSFGGEVGLDQSVMSMSLVEVMKDSYMDLRDAVGTLF